MRAVSCVWFALAATGCGSGDVNPGTNNETDVSWAAGRDSFEVRTLTESPVLCTDCIQLEEELILGDVDGPGYVVITEFITRDSSGNYWLGQFRDMMKTFDEQGNFIRRVGRMGGGPGEYDIPAPMSTDRLGRVHVLDFSQGRETIIKSDFEVDTVLGFPFGMMAAQPLPDGSGYIATGSPETNSRIGFPMHLVKGGEIVSSFGISDTADVSPFELYRTLATHPSGLIFSTWPFDYLIEVWTLDGQRIAGFQGPNLNEIPPQPGSFTKDHPPANKIMAMHLDDQQRLWVIILMVKENWRDYMEEIRLPSGRRILNPIDFAVNNLYTTRIDVVDLSSNRIVARTTLDGYFRTFLDKDLIVENRTLPEGTPVIPIWRYSLDLSRSR